MYNLFSIKTNFHWKIFYNISQSPHNTSCNTMKMNIKKSARPFIKPSGLLCELSFIKRVSFCINMSSKMKSILKPYV